MQRLLGLLVLVMWMGACSSRPKAEPTRETEAARATSTDETFAELRTIKGAVRVREGDGPARAPYRRERLVDGELIELPQGALAWMRRDGGATWLIAGPAELTARAESVELRSGRAFIDSELGAPVQIQTVRGLVELSDARASIELANDGTVSAYVLRGSARVAGETRAVAGEQLILKPGGPATRAAVVSWDDWTGGLATADPVAEPAPFGIGTVGARAPSEQGKPRFSLVVQRMDVKVTIDRDFAVTEVDQTFVNPSANVVEGLFSFRTPPNAVLSRFGVDRKGELVWGRVKETQSAVRQYESNVYEGSEEEPALLQWAGAGVYNARLYPLRAAAARRVVTRYSEWLTREGPNGERRLYVYPMAAEGARASLPRIEELRVTLDLTNARAARVRAGMGGKRDGKRIVVKAYDFVPRADLAVEIFDGGQLEPVAYRAPHRLDAQDVPESAAADFASSVAREEQDYLAIPLRAREAPGETSAGIDLGLLIDSSAATEPGALAIARSMAQALLAHLGPEDRVALWAGDASLRPVAEGSGDFTRIDDTKRRGWLEKLASVERGGATDLGALLSEAASRLDPKRRGAILYVGDGQPTVGELVPKTLAERLARLPATTRILAAGVGREPNIALLQALVRGAPVERIEDAYGAARSALRLLEAAGRPLWLGAKLTLGPGVERVLPRTLPPISSEETTLVVGRITGNKLPTELTLTGSGGKLTQRLRVINLGDGGDLRRRWGEARLAELTGESSGRSALVELSRRYGLVSPFTALYVPTEREEGKQTAPEDSQALAEDAAARTRRWKPWWQPGLLTRGEPAAMAVPSAAYPTKMKQESAPAEEAAAAPVAPPAPVATAANAVSEKRAIGQMFGGEVLDAPEEATKSTAGAKPAARRKSRGSASCPPGDPLCSMAASEVLESPDPAVARQSARDEAREFGMIGQLRGGASPTAAAAAEPISKSASSEVHAKRGAVRGLSRQMSASATASGGDAAPKDASEKPRPIARREPMRILGIIGHEPRPCSPAADLPLAERRLLWRERLSIDGSVYVMLDIYRNALAACEATRWDERAALLIAIVDRLGTVRDRVELWRALLEISPSAADAVYRFLMLRVQTPAELKELHEAMGLSRIDPSMLAALLKKGQTSEERLSLLRGAAERFPDDTELALQVLDAYEDAHDDAGGRAWARRLRRRVDASTHVRTNVGEYYLRLAKGAGGAVAERDANEARRTFGELVEFAPEDPLARRRLGDLLRAHGWYDEALRQYQTLAELTPDDPSVPLLLAAAANGVGRVEEAVRWLQKVADAGAPDGTSQVSLAARALASAFLGWARLEAVAAERKDEADRLRARAARLASGAGGSGVRFVLSWQHPELRPSLWTNALGSPMPATDNLPLYGVAQAFVAESPAPVVELRLDPEDAARAARLDEKAVLTAIVAEGGDGERIARLEVGFRDEQGKPLTQVAVRYENGALAVAPRGARKEGE